MALTGAIGKGPVAIDSAIFIYFIEEHPRYLPLLEALFQSIDRGSVAAVTSALTLLETLVVPYRAGDLELARKYQSILTHGRGLTLVAIDNDILQVAAQIRATVGIGTADALQVATALRANCTALLTNDRRIPSLPSLKVLQLEAFVGAR